MPIIDNPGLLPCHVKETKKWSGSEEHERSIPQIPTNEQAKD